MGPDVSLLSGIGVDGAFELVSIYGNGATYALASVSEIQLNVFEIECQVSQLSPTL